MRIGGGEVRGDGAIRPEFIEVLSPGGMPEISAVKREPNGEFAGGVRKDSTMVSCVSETRSL